MDIFVLGVTQYISFLTFKSTALDCVVVPQAPGEPCFLSLTFPEERGQLVGKWAGLLGQMWVQGGSPSPWPHSPSLNTVHWAQKFGLCAELFPPPPPDLA